MLKRTKIVCTLGPASDSPALIEKMVHAGMDVVRLNFSHGTHAYHEKVIARIRKIEKKIGRPIAILQDLQGPKIRIGTLPDQGIPLTEGASATFTTGRELYRNNIIPIDYTALHRYLKKGNRILLDEGRIEVEVVRMAGRVIHTRVRVAGTLYSNKGINVPDGHIHAGALSSKDKEDAVFGVLHGVDMIALSFVNDGSDVRRLRAFLARNQKKVEGSQPPIRIIAKIERREAVVHMEEIIEAADGIMVARGDLGLEAPQEDVPLIQKKLIDCALEAAKPVIVATQILDSMQERPRPTRAEVSDVANAVIDHSDAVMLSNETAVGKYPLEAVATMARIVVKAEASTYDNMPLRNPKNKIHKTDDVISGLSRVIAEKLNARLILAASLTGETGRMISRYRPEFPILVATSTMRVARQLILSWGVIPFILLPCRTIEELVKASVAYLKKHKVLTSGDKIIIIAGEPVGHAGHVNLLEVRKID